MSSVRDQVRTYYGEAATRVLEGTSCGCGDACAPGGACCDAPASSYGPQERALIPEAAVAASLGCGNPTAVADLREGETVLDLGSGGGIDVLLSARRVGPAGRAYGLDMTEEMLELARRNADEAGVANAEFLRGYIEAIPLPDASVDVVLSNCVINLSEDKASVFAEIARVLRPGGRLGVTDIVADDALSPSDRAERGSHVGCIAGALSFAEYRAELEGAGFTGIELETTHAVTDGMFGTIVRARRPFAEGSRGGRVPDPESA